MLLKKMKVLNSIDEVLEILDTPCVDCVLHGRDGVIGKYTVKREGLEAIFICDLFHVYRALVNFSVSKQDVEDFAKGFKRLADEEGIYNAFRKLQAYVQFGPADAKVDFDGYCLLCGEEVPMRIERKEIYFYCTPCATAKRL